MSTKIILILEKGKIEIMNEVSKKNIALKVEFARRPTLTDQIETLASSKLS